MLTTMYLCSQGRKWSGIVEWLLGRVQYFSEIRLAPRVIREDMYMVLCQNLHKCNLLTSNKFSKHASLGHDNSLVADLLTAINASFSHVPDMCKVRHNLAYCCFFPSSGAIVSIKPFPTMTLSSQPLCLPQK